jgi:hypothetical protein
MKRVVLVAAVLLVLAVVAYAQMGGPPAGQQPMMPMSHMMMPSGAPIMLAQGDSLFILRGDQLIKVNANTLEVAKSVMLPKPEMPRPPGN